MLQSSDLRTKYEEGAGLIFVMLGVLVLAVFIGTALLVHKKSSVLVKISNGCTDTNITLQPAELRSIDAPLTVQAKLVMGAQPVANEKITFRAVGTDNHQRSLMEILGYANTDEHGIATLQKPTGIADVSITYGKGGVLTGYRAEFNGNNATDRVKDKTTPFYCGGSTTTNFPTPLTIQKVGL